MSSSGNCLRSVRRATRVIVRSVPRRFVYRESHLIIFRQTQFVCFPPAEHRADWERGAINVNTRLHTYAYNVRRACRYRLYLAEYTRLVIDYMYNYILCWVYQAHISIFSLLPTKPPDILVGNFWWNCAHPNKRLVVVNSSWVYYIEDDPYDIHTAYWSQVGAGKTGFHMPMSRYPKQ